LINRIKHGVGAHARWALVLVIALVAAVLSAYDWPQLGLNSRHNGSNTQETIISPANVGSLQRFLSITLPATADGAPAFQSAVATAGGTTNVLFLTTKDGRILALDWLTGATLWSRQVGPGSCKINNGSASCYTTSSPVIDPNRLYVYSYGLDGYVHKYQVANGTEITTGGWPELASLKPYDEKGSSALSIATAANQTSYLYVTSAGYPGDNGNYQGHLTAINLGDGSQHVFNTLCSDQTVHFTAAGQGTDCASVQGAIWARPGVIYDSDTNKIYMSTGNGTYSPSLHAWGDTVFALNPDGTGVSGGPLDAYTPANYQYLQDNDVDIGSTAPAILPNTSNYPHLAVQGGKDSVLRLINLDNLSGQSGPGHTGGELFTMNVPQGNEVLTQPAVWVNPADGSTWVFVSNDNGLSGLKLVVTSGNPSLVKQWQNASGGTSPIVANGVLYYAGSNNLWALNPATGAVLWHNTQIGPIHWESPIVANGALYITDDNGGLSGFAVNGSPVTPTATVTGAASATATATARPATATPTSTATVSAGQTVTVTAQVAASSDDANQDGSALDLTSGTVWLGNASSTTSSYTGLRFNNLALPPGATINSARLQVFSVQTQWLSISFNLAAEAIGNSPTFSTGNLPSQRTLTTQSVAHQSDVQWLANTWYSLDEMAPVIQTVVSRPDWQSGNSLSVILTGTGGAWGRMFALSDDGSPASAPKLIISYHTAGAATNTPAPTATGMPAATATHTAAPTMTSSPASTPTAAIPTSTATVSGGQTVTITAQVAASSDDANQDSSALDLTSGTVWLGNASSATASYTGLRFTNLALPPGATINSARLQLYSSQSQWIGISLNLAAEAIGNSPAFSASNPPGQRTLTTQSVAHQSDVQWLANTWYSLDEMAPVIQAVVSRPDWQSGNSLSVILTGTGGAWGRKFALSYDGSPANAARLIITYTK
jgi:outer membrane protein assembly factor BamB